MNPSEKFKQPIIGKLKTKELKLKSISQDGEKEHILESEEYDVIQVINEGKKIFITNYWYDEFKFKPLALIEDLVEEFIPN